MTKNFTLSILLFLIATTVHGQNPYYDAIFLSEKSTTVNEKIQINLDNNSIDSAKVVEIFTKYLNPGQPSIKNQFNDISENPFISITSGQEFGTEEVGAAVTGLIGKAGTLNVTNIADGLAKFLVERTKEELSIAFFEKFYETLDDQAQLRLLFPATYKTLRIIGDEIYMFSGYIEMLRQAFQKDLATMLPNLKTLINDQSMDEIFAKHPELRTILSDGIYLALQLKDGNHIGDAVNNYITTEADPDKLGAVNANIYPSMALLNIFSQSLRTKPESEKYWITADQLKKLQEEKVLKLYLGLVYQQIYLFEKEHSKIELAGKSALTILKDASADFETLRAQITAITTLIIEKGRVIDQKFSQIKKLQQQPDTKPGYQDFYELLHASLNFVAVVKETYSSLSTKPANDKFDAFLLAARSLGTIYVNINEKHYVSAVAELAYLYEDLIVKQLKNDKVSEDVMAKRAAFLKAFNKLLKDENDIDLVTKIKTLIENNKESVPPADIIIAFVNQGEGKKEIKAKLVELNILEYEKTLAARYEKLIDQLIKYGNFAAVVAKAQSSTQIKEAIESIALPAGSSRIKRESAFNVSLNAYMGLYVGYENIELEGNHNYQFATGLAAPVGVAMSWGFGGKEKNKGGKSFSLLLSLIDIGAIASFRFNDDETESTPDIELKDIISPGVFGVFGFGKVPLSAGLGYQIGPRLHEVTATQATTVSDTYGRFSLFLAVDIPIINFHTRPK